MASENVSLDKKEAEGYVPETVEMTDKGNNAELI